MNEIEAKDLPSTRDQEEGVLAHANGLSFKSLCIVARLHEISTDAITLKHQLGIVSNESIDNFTMLRAAKYLGLKARAVKASAKRLEMTPLPALAKMKSAEGIEYFIVLARCDSDRVLVQGSLSSTSRPQIQSLKDFCAGWSGELILITSRASAIGELAKFDFSWFIPSLVKYRRILTEVLTISVMLQIFGLMNPLFVQVIMDKVLVHRGLNTLDVLLIGIVIIVIFESLLSGLRSYVFSHTTNRIDVELGARLFRHLIRLPLSYYQARRVGDSTARVRELENIRNFLTGSALTALIDSIFSIVFIIIMLVYSKPLTMIVLASLPIYILLSLITIPILRKRLDIKFAKGAENQAMLVETISGIQTVKASALEPAFSRRWDNQLAAYVSASFKANNLSSWAREGVNLTGKLVNAGTLWYGSHLVMDGDLTVGQFVAFNMFAQRVSQPIIRMAQLWTDFQQTGISMARLGDVLNAPSEMASKAGSNLPSIKGRVTFDNVIFRYRSESAPILKGISLDIKPGEIIGIVGRSGSGKSTLTKLIQKLYTPEEGRILIDGIDIASLDTTQLRTQIGVVLQENLLFNRTVRENIAIIDPAAPLEDVVAAAKLAGADDFISDLADGYDTVIGEQGSTLSGGQRQRIAIARALFNRPRVLIFDEATSALDYESEAIVQRNMVKICSGRTVFIIAHRLSAVKNADRILVLEKGEVLETGAHDDLLSNPESSYAQLWSMQDQGKSIDQAKRVSA